MMLWMVDFCDAYGPVSVSVCSCSGSGETGVVSSGVSMVVSVVGSGSMAGMVSSGTVFSGTLVSGVVSSTGGVATVVPGVGCGS